MANIILEFSKRFLREYDSLKRKNRRLYEKVDGFLREIKSDPLTGTGKVEQLSETRYSRRVDQKNRLVYDFFPKTGSVRILCCLGHYDKI
jgi:Txe/YoeB family toxin of toxin-antitoxin system